MSPQNVKLDLHFNGEILSTSEDRKLVGQIPLKDRAVRRFSVDSHNVILNFWVDSSSLLFVMLE